MMKLKKSMEFLITMNLLECISEYAKICHGKHASKERI